MSVSAVIVASGSSKRMNNGVDKLSLQIGGRSLLAWTISRFEMTEIIDEIIIVTRAEEIENVKELSKEEGFKKISSIVRGGSHRQNSTQNGLRAVSSKTGVVLVHDGARPLIHPSDIKKIAESADKKLQNAIRAGRVPREGELDEQISLAVKASIMTDTEAQALKEFETARADAIAVDEFPFDYFAKQAQSKLKKTA